MKIIIIGGGVSGLAISCKLAKEKIDNLLIEKRPFLRSLKRKCAV